MGNWFLGHGELWWVASHPQGVESAQVIDIGPDADTDTHQFYSIIKR